MLQAWELLQFANIKLFYGLNAPNIKVPMLMEFIAPNLMEFDAISLNLQICLNIFTIQPYMFTSQHTDYT